MRWFLLGYMFLFIHRPFEVWPALGDLRIELVYMLAVGAYWVLYPGKRWLPNSLQYAVAAWLVAVAVCCALSPWAERSLNFFDTYWRMAVFYLLLVSVVHDEDGLKQVVACFLIVMTVYMLHSLREFFGGRHVFRMGIPRLIGIDSTSNDPNAFGATIVYSLVFLPAVWPEWTSARGRAFLVGYVLLALTCIGLTGSRSSLVGLVVCAGYVALRSQRRWQFLVLGLAAAPLLFAALPPALQTRFESIIDPSVGPANARESALGRLQGLVTGARLFSEHPFTGCGPRTWRTASGSKLESHNLYGQVIGETGMLGVAAFAFLLLAIWHNLRSVRRAYREHPEWGKDFPARVADSIGLAVLLLLFIGNFSHNLFRYTWLWYAGMLVITRHVVRLRAEAAATAWEPPPRETWAMPAAYGL